MRQCTRCIQIDAYPGLEFDDAGVCSLCRSFEQRWHGREVSESEEGLLEIMEKAGQRNPKYQVLVGVSGGKDSSYALHLMVKRYKARVLALTHDNGFLSDDARKNIDLMVKKLGVEHRYTRIDPGLWKKMYRALVKNRCTDLCMVCMTGTLASLNEVALKERIPVIAWGLSPRTEPILSSDVSCTMDWRYLVDATKPHVERSELRGLKYVDLPWLFHVLIIRRIRHLMLPEYVAWHDEDIANFLSREYGWVDYGDRKHHFDCMVNPAMDFFMFRRIGITKERELLSQMVRSGQLTRDEALARNEKHGAVAEPLESVAAFCSRVGLSRDDIRPFLEGKTFGCHQFKSYTSMLERMSWIFWLTYKLGLTTETFYQKYHRR